MAKDALIKVGAGVLERPAFIPEGDTRGRTKVERDDVQMPRLAVAQGLSPQLDPEKAEYIEGLKLGDMFNTLTGQVYGRGPLEVVVVRQYPPRYVEFFPRNEGGGVKDFNVPAGDPRTEFTTGPDGKAVPPAATKFLEFVALVGPAREPVALSFKNTQLKAGRVLNGLIQARGAGLPAFATVFTLTTGKQKNAKGEFYVPTVKVKGNVDEATFRQAEALFEVVKDKELAIDREGAGEAHEAEGGAGEDVPF